MSSVILRDFSLTRDFRSICWGATIWYNTVRAFFAGIVIMAFLLLSDGYKDPVQLITPIAWPFAWLIFFLPLGMILSLFSAVPFVNLFAAFISFIAVGCGDPLVCIVHKMAPKMVPVAAPPIISFKIIFWVLNASEISVSD